MALPPSHVTRQVQHLRDTSDRTPIHQLEMLVPDDFRLIGTFVQIYNFLELNLRRSIDIFDRAKLLQRPKRIGRGRWVELANLAVQAMDPAQEPIAETLGRLTEIDDRRSWRNLLAHGAAKRIPAHDALVLISQDSADAQRLFGQSNMPDQCWYAVVRLPDLRGLTIHINQYERWLSEKTSEWHRRYLPTT